MLRSHAFCLCIVYDCCFTIIAELRNFSRTQKPEILAFWLFIGKFCYSNSPGWKLYTQRSHLLVLDTSSNRPICYIDLYITSSKQTVLVIDLYGPSDSEVSQQNHNLNSPVLQTQKCLLLRDKSHACYTRSMKQMVVNVALSAYYAPGIALSIVRIQEQCKEPFIQSLYRTQIKKKKKKNSSSTR